MITNWIGAFRQIFVIVAKDLRDVEDLFIVTHFKARESIGYSVFSLLIYLSSGTNSSIIRRQHITRSVLKFYRLDFYDQYRPLSGVLIEYYGTL